MKGIEAYDLPERVNIYDLHMDIMHPNRSKMIDVVLEAIPLDGSLPFTALELGAGTGYFTEKFLDKFPNAKIISIDGVESMLAIAEARLGTRTDKVDFRAGDFRELSSLISPEEKGDVLFTSYALHHLNRTDKMDVIEQCIQFLNPGGWFFNADIVVAETKEAEDIFQKVRIERIIKNASGKYEEYKDFDVTRKTLDELEAKEEDQPLTLIEDLDMLKNALLQYVTPFWLEYREAVFGGQKRA